MLGGLAGSYRFPSLVWFQKVHTKFNEKPMNEYVLCWDKIDERIRDLHGNPSDYFPEEMRKLIEGPLILTKKYHSAAVYFSQLALTEGAGRHGFDRQHIIAATKAPGIAAANAAFKILCDCAYDPETMGWDRKPTRHIRYYAMLYYFWLTNSPPNEVFMRAKVEELRYIARGGGAYSNGFTAEERELAGSYYNYFTNKLVEINDQMTESGGVLGKSLEGEIGNTRYHRGYVVHTDNVQIINGKLVGKVNLDHDHYLEVKNEPKLVPPEHDEFYVPMYEHPQIYEGENWAHVKADFHGQKLVGYFRSCPEDLPRVEV